MSHGVHAYLRHRHPEMTDATGSIGTFRSGVIATVDEVVLWTAL